MKAEARVLKSLQSCSRVVRLVEQGSIDGRSFMVMEVRAVASQCRTAICQQYQAWYACVAAGSEYVGRLQL